MFCPTCQTVLREAPELCPTCGEPMRPIGTSDSIEIVEGSAETGTFTMVSLDDAYANGEATAQSFALVASAKTPAMTALARLPQLSALVWRQPAVRAAVKTGASALALSLAVRAARTALAGVGRGPQRAMTNGVLPALSEMLAQRESGGRGQRVPVGEVVESYTYIYMRRVIRR